MYAYDQMLRYDVTLWLHIIGYVTLRSILQTGSREVAGSIPEYCHWNFSLTQFFQPNYDPGVDSASNWNKYHEYLLGVKVAGVYSWHPYQPQPPGTLRACPARYMDCFTYTANDIYRTVRKQLILLKLWNTFPDAE